MISWRTVCRSLALLSLFSCSSINPKEGALQTKCGLDPDGEAMSGPSKGYYGASSGQTLGGPTCAANPDSPCDDCEASRCCAMRSACYGDPVCACADLRLDQCLDAAEGSAPADHAVKVSACWSAFNAKGEVEEARLSCQRSWCQAQCGIP